LSGAGLSGLCSGAAAASGGFEVPEMEAGVAGGFAGSFAGGSAGAFDVAVGAASAFSAFPAGAYAQQFNRIQEHQNVRA